ncbi:winged helix-turn-helix domain-containing protein [Lysobacter soli]|uniref:winged helix-turn-helix domain-containing protein n=1 Tax=Lysobacter soli TaxID=453783 RepID=UPI0037C9445B
MHAHARTSDPITSHIAAAEVSMSGQRAFQAQTTAAAVKRYPGKTSRELSVLLKLDRHMLGRRLSECEEEKLVRRGAMRRCATSGRLSLTWWPPDVAEQLALPIEEIAA